MKNYLSNINWGGALFCLITILIVIGFMLTIIKNLKIKKETFNNPEQLDLNDAGKYFKVKELSGEKVLLEILFSGWNHELAKFTNTEVWCKKEGIPGNLLMIGNVFQPASNGTNLVFS